MLSLLKFFIFDKDNLPILNTGMEEKMGCCHSIDFYNDQVAEIPVFTFDGSDMKCIISEVLDGDTVDICFFYPPAEYGKFENIQKRRLRLYGIDCPEIHSRDHQEKAAGLKSKEYLSLLILGKTVHIKCTKEEKYGRLMGTIYYQGEDINKRMVTTGHAREYFGEKKEKWTLPQLKNEIKID